jgi:hypothetical protein
LREHALRSPLDDRLGHAVEHLMEMHVGRFREACEQRLREGRMRAGVAVGGHLPRLCRGDEQEIAGVWDFEIAEAELGLGGGRADVAHRIVAAGVEHDDFLLRARQRLEHLVHQHAARHLLALAIHIGVHGHEHVALGRADAVARVEHEGEVRALGLLRELADGGGKAIAGHVEAAGPLAVAGDGIEAALREQPRHALRVDAGVVQRVQLRVGAVADDERHALFRRRVRSRDECGQKNAGDQANAHARLPFSISGAVRECKPGNAIAAPGSVYSQCFGLRVSYALPK